eukprot:6180664-Pleurochrysis_carterae.AAC.3
MYIQAPCGRVVVVVATQPVLEGGIGNVDHDGGKSVLVAGLNALLHARFLVSRGHLLIVELLGMLTTYSRVELVVEEDGVQLIVLLEVQNVLEVALELTNLALPHLVNFLATANFAVVGHDEVDVSVDAARWCCCGQSSGCQMPIALVLVKAVGCSVVVEVLWIVEVLPYGRYSNGQERQIQGTQQDLETISKQCHRHAYVGTD